MLCSSWTCQLKITNIVQAPTQINTRQWHAFGWIRKKNEATHWLKPNSQTRDTVAIRTCLSRQTNTLTFNVWQNSTINFFTSSIRFAILQDFWEQARKHSDMFAQNNDINACFFWPHIFMYFNIIFYTYVTIVLLLNSHNNFFFLSQWILFLTVNSLAHN